MFTTDMDMGPDLDPRKKIIRIFETKANPVPKVDRRLLASAMGSKYELEEQAASPAHLLVCGHDELVPVLRRLVPGEAVVGDIVGQQAQKSIDKKKEDASL
jgi:hypothetical protein